MAELDHEAIAEQMGAQLKGRIPVRHGSIGSRQTAAEIVALLRRDGKGESDGAERMKSESAPANRRSR